MWAGGSMTAFITDCYDEEDCHRKLLDYLKDYLTDYGLFLKEPGYGLYSWEDEYGNDYEDEDQNKNHPEVPKASLP